MEENTLNNFVSPQVNHFNGTLCLYLYIVIAFSSNKKLLLNILPQQLK